MELKQEIIEDNKDLTPEQKKKLATQIVTNFNQWDIDRNEQITTATSIMQETYLRQPKRSYKDGLEWKSDVKLNKLYNIKKARKSVMWREMWSNTAQMFDVRGTNEQTEEQAKQQKAALVDALEKMDIGRQYDKGVDNLFDIGEIIFKTDWVQKKKIVKRQDKNIGWVLKNIVSAATGAGYAEKEFKNIEIPVYENARVESISPFMFVFDHSKYKVQDKDSWDSIVKIYKRFDTYDNIKNNRVYTLTKDQLEKIKQSTQADDSSENKEPQELRQEETYGGKVAILYAHGDFHLDGKTYKNYVAEVVAGELARFEENPLYINPFIMCAIEYDPVTKRGISPLASCLDLCSIRENLTNTAFDVQKLSANPPCWVNEDLIDDENTEADGSILYQPGKYLKYKETYTGSLPQVAEFSSAGISDLLAYVDNEINDLSSTSSVTYGNIEDSKRTATELSLADKGSTAQTGKDMDIINQDLTMPMIENVAALLATFKDGVDFVYAQEKGKNIEYKITNEIRQAEYNYSYEDRNAMHDRKAKFQELYQLCEGAAQIPQLQNNINWKEIFITGIENIGYDNVDKYFVDPTPIEQFSEQFKQLPEDIQQQLLPVYQQTAQQALQQKQQQEMQQRALQQVQMDNMRAQARQQVEQEQMLSQMQEQGGYIPGTANEGALNYDNQL